MQEETLVGEEEAFTTTALPAATEVAVDKECQGRLRPKALEVTSLDVIANIAR